MSITVVKEGNVLRILSSSAPIPEKITLELEVKNPDPWDLAQLDSVFSEDEEDWGRSLDALRLPPLHPQIREKYPMGDSLVKPGQLFAADWPFTDASHAKSRPALAISAEDSRGDIELLMVTSRHLHSDSLPITPNDYVDLPLPHESSVRLGRAVRVNLDRLIPLAARVTPKFLAAVRKAVILGDTRAYSALVHQANRPAYEVADTAHSEGLAVESSQNGPRSPTHQPINPATHQPSTWRPGQTIPYAGRVFNQDEVEAAVGSTLDFWLTLGPEGEAFEKELAGLLGVKHSLLVNSGSSANLVAISALTTHKLPSHKRIVHGDEVITVAAGFPTTVSPILQVGAVPVFIDNDPQTGNLRVDQLEAAYCPGKTKAVMMAHALGNPFDLGAVLTFCRKYDLWLIEDNCDALGCTYSMPVAQAKALGGLDHLLKLAEAGTHPLIRFENAEKLKTENLKSGSGLSASRPFNISAFSGNLLLTAPTGAWGDLSTQSFYPPHHLTMGEGGAVNIVHRPPLKTYAESFRDWGRDCWCASGIDDTCGKRFQWQLGELPKGYDHKYIYSHLGYNLKPLDPQAAIGRQQLKKLPAFIEARKRNWEILRTGLADLGEFFEFTLPTHAERWVPPGERRTLGPPNLDPGLSAFAWDSTDCRTDCSWFGFMLRVNASAPFSRTELARQLDKNKIGNRMLFGGNLLRQPVFVQLKKDRPKSFRVVGDMTGADEFMHNALFLGTYPGLSLAMLEYEIDVIHDFVKAKRA